MFSSAVGVVLLTGLAAEDPSEGVRVTDLTQADGHHLRTVNIHIVHTICQRTYVRYIMGSNIIIFYYYILHNYCVCHIETDY